MKLNKLTLILGASAIMMTALTADTKNKNAGDFLKVNPNIKNEALLSELDQLKLEFDSERQKIQELYSAEIQKLKEERKAEIRALKVEYSERKDVIIKSYGDKIKSSATLHKQKPDKTVVDKSKLKKRQ